MKSLLDITVRSTEIDFLGHVNNSKYQEYLEWGRFQWTRDANLTRDRFAHARVAPVVVHVSIDYRNEARLDDMLTIETQLCRVGSSSLHFHQAVRRTDGVLACEGRVVLAIFDLDRRSSTAIPDDLRVELSRLLIEIPGQEPETVEVDFREG
ncbi:MAG: thioesterase-3 [Kiritimatiellia bacterium]|jgi:thioesterase-3